MTTKHTEGPWGQSSTMSSDFQGIRYITDQGGNRIAKVLYVDKKDQDELLANARLFAAAPKLLEACEDALLNLSGDFTKARLTTEELKQKLMFLISNTKWGS